MRRRKNKPDTARGGSNPDGGNMFQKVIKRTGVFGLVVAMVFVAAFATYNSRRTGDGEASGVACVAGSEQRIFFSDIAAYSTRGKRMIVDKEGSRNGWLTERTFALPDGTKIQPGRYEVRSISSDNHYAHRSSAPGQDKQSQPNERYYITIDGQRTAKTSLDFTDYYDWRGNGSEVMQDDNNDIDSVPEVIRTTWQGESLGVIDVSNVSNSITATHAGVYEDFNKVWNSVVPSALVLKCQEVEKPSLEVEKLVDANGDGQFNTTAEEYREGEPVRWKIIGKNSGKVTDPTAKIRACLPSGLEYVEGSAKVLSGNSGQLTTDSACLEWTGELATGDSVEIVLDATISDYESCKSGDEQGACKCIAKIHSEATGTTLVDPADTDDARITKPESELSIIKKVDGSDDNSAHSDDSERIVPDGSTVSWQIMALNTGLGSLVDARIVDTYPVGVTLGTIDASHGEVTVDGSTVVWNGELKPGQDVTINVSSTVDNVAAYNECEQLATLGNRPGDNRCTNRAFVGQADGDGSDLKGTVKHDDAEIFAVLNPELTVKKYVDGADADNVFSDQEVELVEPGKGFSWRVVGCNVGSAIQASARIVDVVLPGLGTVNVSDIVVSGAGELSGVTIVTDPVSGRPAIVWNGSIDVSECVTLQYTTIIADQAGFQACVGASSIDSSTCGADAYIGEPKDDTEVSVDEATKSSDPAFVTANFASVLKIEKFVDGDSDGNYNAVSEQTDLGERFSWKIVGRNEGDGSEPTARIVDALPVDIDLMSSEGGMQVDLRGGAVTAGLDVVEDNGVKTVVWNGSLPVGASVEVVFSAMILDEQKLKGCFNSTTGELCRNTAVIGVADGSSATKVTGQTDSDSADVFAVPEGKLTITKEVDVDGDGSWSDAETIVAGESFEWRINVANQGSGTVNDVAVLDVFPDGVIVEEVVSEPENGNTELVAGEDRFRLFWSADSLAPGDTAEFVVRSKIADNNSFNLCDKSEVDGDEDQFCSNEAFVGVGKNVEDFRDTDSDRSQVDILRTPNLYIDKSVDGVDSDDEATNYEKVSVEGDKPFEWVVTFGNDGNGVADEVSLVDVLPEGLDYLSHDIEGSETSAEYDAGTRRISWEGSIEPEQEIKITINTSLANIEAFVICDIATGEQNEQCTNFARLSDDGEEIKDSAIVVTEGSKVPELAIKKTVDADNDGVFSDVEDVDTNNTITTWRIEVSNSGDGPASDVVTVDKIAGGLQYVQDSLVEVSGSDLGIASYDDGSIVWNGDIPAGEAVVIEFDVLLESAASFNTCNFSDGNAVDSRCVNVVSLFSGGDSSGALSASVASVTTSLPKVLAYTGSKSGYISVLVGVGIAFAAVLLTLGGTLMSKKRGGGDNGDSNGTPTHTNHVPHIIMPQ